MLLFLNIYTLHRVFSLPRYPSSRDRYHLHISITHSTTSPLRYLSIFSKSSFPLIILAHHFASFLLLQRDHPLEPRATQYTYGSRPRFGVQQTPIWLPHKSNHCHPYHSSQGSRSQSHKKNSRKKQLRTSSLTLLPSNFKVSTPFTKLWRYGHPSISQLLRCYQINLL